MIREGTWHSIQPIDETKLRARDIKGESIRGDLHRSLKRKINSDNVGLICSNHHHRQLSMLTVGIRSRPKQHGAPRTVRKQQEKYEKIAKETSTLYRIESRGSCGRLGLASLDEQRSILPLHLTLAYRCNVCSLISGYLACSFRSLVFVWIFLISSHGDCNRERDSRRSFVVPRGATSATADSTHDIEPRNTEDCSHSLGLPVSPLYENCDVRRSTGRIPVLK